MGSPPTHKINVACLSHWWNHVDTANPHVIWDLLRHTVQHQLLNNQAIALPFLSDLRFYKLHAGIIKKLSSTTKRLVLGEPSQYQLAGELSKLAAEMTEVCKAKIANVARNMAADVNQHWHASLSDKRGGEMKVIELLISGCQLEKTEKFEPDDLRINVELLSEFAGEKEAPPQALYVINERYLATLYLSATIGETTKQFVYENFPVGIVLYKYRLEPDGKMELAKEIRGENFNGEWRRIAQAPQAGERSPVDKRVDGEPLTPTSKRKRAQNTTTPDPKLLHSAGKK